MPNPTIEVARNHRRAAEADVLAALQSLEASTGLTVENVRLIYDRRMTGDKPTTDKLVDVHIDVVLGR